jgi:hypothetical protein
MALQVKKIELSSSKIGAQKQRVGKNYAGGT